MKLTTTFEFSKVKFDQDNQVHLLISAQAPKVDWEKERKPIAIVASIDESSSMIGDKIEYAKKSLLKLIDNLGSQDRLAIVGFESSVRVIAEMQKMTQANKDKFKTEVQKIQARGCTNFSGAVAESLRQAQKADISCRVIMFTDGQPTTGDCSLDNILKMVKNRPEVVSVSGFGYGTDHDSKFLAGMADLGQGNYCFVKTPDDALVAFARELGGLLSCYAQNLKFTVMPKPDVKIEEVLNDIDVEELDGGAVRISVPNLYGEETRHLVLKATLPKQANVLPRSKTVMEVELSYDSVKEGKEIRVTEKAKVWFVKNGDIQKDPDQTVRDQVVLAQLSKAHLQAQKLADIGDFSSARLCMSSVNLNGTSEAVGYAHTLTSNFYVSQDAYLSNQHDVTATSSALRSQRGSGGTSSQLFATDNTVQKGMVDNFTDGSIGVVDSTTPGTIGDCTVMPLISSPSFTFTIANTPNITYTPAKKKPIAKRRSADSW